MPRFKAFKVIASCLCCLGRLFMSDTRGATAVEFALVAIPFLGTIVVSMAVGIVFFFSTTLDFAVQKASRSMMTGAIKSGQMSATQYRTGVFCPMLLAAFDCNNIIINVKVERTAAQAATNTGYTDLVNSNQTALLVTAYTNSGSAQFCTGQPGDYVYIQVLYPLPALTTFLSPAGSVATVNGQPAFLLDSTLAFRNEQFGVNTGC
jgi:Flp pilus assembly protein TadG